MLCFNSKEDNPKLMWLISWMVQFLPYSIAKLRFFHFKGKIYFIYASFKDCPTLWSPFRTVSFHKVDFNGLMLGIWIPKISTANQSYRWKFHLTYFCLKYFITFWIFAKRMWLHWVWSINCSRYSDTCCNIRAILIPLLLFPR